MKKKNSPYLPHGKAAAKRAHIKKFFMTKSQNDYLSDKRSGFVQLIRSSLLFLLALLSHVLNSKLAKDCLNTCMSENSQTATIQKNWFNY